MPAMSAEQAHAYLQETEEQRMRCLARWLLDHFKSLQARRDSLERIRKHMVRALGAEEADNRVEALKSWIFLEHENRKQKA